MDRTSLENIISNEVKRLTEKYNKDFLDCDDIIKITGLGRDNVRNLLRSKNFPSIRVGKRLVVSVANFVTYTMFQNKEEDDNGKEKWNS